MPDGAWVVADGLAVEASTAEPFDGGTFVT